MQYQHPPETDEAAHEFRTEQLRHRRQEVSGTIDLLCSEETPANIWRQKSGSEFAVRDDLVDNPLAILKDRIRTDSVAIAGHSFGAATSFLSAQQDERINSVLGLDPWMFPLPTNFHKSYQQRAVPTLVINSSTFHWPTNLAALATLLKRNHELGAKLSMQITLTDTSHLDQSDFAAIIPAWLRSRYRSGAISDPLRVLTTNAQLDLAFFNVIFNDNENDNGEELLLPYRNILWGDNESERSCSEFKVDFKL